MTTYTQKSITKEADYIHLKRLAKKPLLARNTTLAQQKTYDECALLLQGYLDFKNTDLASLQGNQNDIDQYFIYALRLMFYGVPTGETAVRNIFDTGLTISSTSLLNVSGQIWELPINTLFRLLAARTEDDSKQAEEDSATPNHQWILDQLLADDPQLAELLANEMDEHSQTANLMTRAGFDPCPLANRQPATRRGPTVLITTPAGQAAPTTVDQQADDDIQNDPGYQRLTELVASAPSSTLSPEYRQAKKEYEHLLQAYPSYIKTHMSSLSNADEITQHFATTLRLIKLNIASAKTVMDELLALPQLTLATGMLFAPSRDFKDTPLETLFRLVNSNLRDNTNAGIAERAFLHKIIDKMLTDNPALRQILIDEKTEHSNLAKLMSDANFNPATFSTAKRKPNLPAANTSSSEVEVKDEFSEYRSVIDNAARTMDQSPDVVKEAVDTLKAADVLADYRLKSSLRKLTTATKNAANPHYRYLVLTIQEAQLTKAYEMFYASPSNDLSVNLQLWRQNIGKIIVKLEQLIKHDPAQVDEHFLSVLALAIDAYVFGQSHAPTPGSVPTAIQAQLDEESSIQNLDLLREVGDYAASAEFHTQWLIRHCGLLKQLPSQNGIAAEERKSETSDAATRLSEAAAAADSLENHPAVIAIEHALKFTGPKHQHHMLEGTVQSLKDMNAFTDPRLEDRLRQLHAHCINTGNLHHHRLVSATCEAHLARAREAFNTMADNDSLSKAVTQWQTDITKIIEFLGSSHANVVIYDADSPFLNTLVSVMSAHVFGPNSTNKLTPEWVFATFGRSLPSRPNHRILGQGFLTQVPSLLASPEIQAALLDTHAELARQVAALASPAAAAETVQTTKQAAQPAVTGEARPAASDTSHASPTGYGATFAKVPAPTASTVESCSDSDAAAPPPPPSDSAIEVAVPTTGSP